MAGLSEAEANQVARRLSRQNAPPEESEAYESTALEWVSNIFRSAELDGQPISHWANVPHASIVQNASRFSCFRNELKGATALYVNQVPWLHCRQFDWLLANLLAYAELTAALLALGNASRWTKGELNWSRVIIKLVWGLFVWGAWLAILLALIAIDLTWLAALWAAFTGVVQALAWRARFKRRRLLLAMIDSYHSINSMDLSWSVVWDYLSKSRDLGAVWDQELYQLVERLRSRSAV